MARGGIGIICTDVENALLAWTVIAVDDFFESDQYVPERARQCLRRLASLKSEHVDAWDGRFKLFCGLKNDIALSIALTDELWDGDVLNRERFNELIRSQ